MLRLLTDEDIHGGLVAALRRADVGLDVMSVAEAGLNGTHDEQVLAWAAEQGRVVVTHDVNTMTRYAGERMKRGERFPGMLVVPQSLRIGAAMRDIVTIVATMDAASMTDRIIYLPL